MAQVLTRHLEYRGRFSTRAHQTDCPASRGGRGQPQGFQEFHVVILSSNVNLAPSFRQAECKPRRKQQSRHVLCAREQGSRAFVKDG